MLIFINHDDIRSLELMEELIARGYYVSDSFKDLKYANVIYMGAKGIDSKNRLLTHQETISIEEESLKAIKKNTLILTLIHNDYLAFLSKKLHFRYIALLDDEEFVCQNSILTAEGLISYLIMHRRFPLYHCRIGILGFGHCAKPLAEYLSALKANVSVGVRKEEYKEDIESLGCQYFHIQDLDLSQYDVLINTVPTLVVTKEHLDKANKRLMLIDIASYPYGIDHHYALSKGLNCIILPSIPSKYAYGYAGLMIADKIEREIEDD